MAGLKTNERPGTRAVARHSHLSAFKAREVLDLIRGVDYARASEILEHSERGAAEVIGKLLHSAASNAQHNEGLEPEEMFVSACFADEGTTMKRWRPRARGRATRIRKRTCHITVILSRMPDEELQRRRARVAAEQMERRQRRVAGTRRARRQQADVEAEVAAEEAAEAELLAAAADSSTDISDSEPTETEAAAAPLVEPEAADTSEADEGAAAQAGVDEAAVSPAAESAGDGVATDEATSDEGASDEAAADKAAADKAAADKAAADKADFSGADEEESE